MLQEKLLELFLYMGSEWVMLLLILLSVVSLGIVIERFLHFNNANIDLEQLQEGLQGQLEQSGVKGGLDFLAGKPSPAARVAEVGLNALNRGPDTAAELMAGRTKVERLKMERGLAFLGTLGNNAPFLGLFGTVLGIIRSFRDLALNTSEGSQAVMAGIAEALVATAVGLLVALPAVAMFNTFQRLIRTRLAGVDAATRLVLAYGKSKSS